MENDMLRRLSDVKYFWELDELDERLLESEGELGGGALQCGNKEGRRSTTKCHEALERNYPECYAVNQN